MQNFDFVKNMIVVASKIERKYPSNSKYESRIDLIIDVTRLNEKPLGNVGSNCGLESANDSVEKTKQKSSEQAGFPPSAC